jgi:hypothetical protein
MTASTRAGRWIRQQAGAEGFSAFVPAPLSPAPPLTFSPELQRLGGGADRALGTPLGDVQEVSPYVAAKGITGAGTCKGTFSPDGGSTWDIEGDYKTQ